MWFHSENVTILTPNTGPLALPTAAYTEKYEVKKHVNQ
jgi:hypothetical protein